jgi:hypothetical protein
MLVEPNEKRYGLVFPGCDVEGRFRGDVGRGIFVGDGTGAALDEPPVLVDVDIVESLAVPAPPAVGSFPLTNAWSDICFKLLESGGSFDTEADLCLVDDIFDFATAPVGFGGRSLERTVLEGGGISATSDEGPATAPVVAVGTSTVVS